MKRTTLEYGTAQVTFKEFRAVEDATPEYGTAQITFGKPDVAQGEAVSLTCGTDRTANPADIANNVGQLAPPEVHAALGDWSGKSAE